MDMLPVWDFSPEFDQLQAAEFMWNPEPDQAAVQVPTGAGGLAGAPGPTVSQHMVSESGTVLHDEAFWERDFAAVPQGRGPGRTLLQVEEPPASLVAAPGPSRQDSLLPTPSPADNAAEDNDNNPMELQQRQRTGSSDSTERSKAVNRESQRRFRLRQKVHLCLLHL